MRPGYQYSDLQVPDSISRSPSCKPSQTHPPIFPADASLGRKHRFGGGLLRYALNAAHEGRPDLSQDWQPARCATSFSAIRSSRAPVSLMTLQISPSRSSSKRRAATGIMPVVAHVKASKRERYPPRVCRPDRHDGQAPEILRCLVRCRALRSILSQTL